MLETLQQEKALTKQILQHKCKKYSLILSLTHIHVCVYMHTITYRKLGTGFKHVQQLNQYAIQPCKLLYKLLEQRLH